MCTDTVSRDQWVKGLEALRKELEREDKEDEEEEEESEDESDNERYIPSSILSTTFVRYPYILITILSLSPVIMKWRMVQGELEQEAPRSGPTTAGVS